MKIKEVFVLYDVKIDELNKKLLKLNKKCNTLKQNKFIINYFELISDIEKTQIKLLKAISLKQKQCNHVNWYLLNCEKDDYEGRTYYKCKCLNCDIIMTSRSKDFENVIDSNQEFHVIKELIEIQEKLMKDIKITTKKMK